jgi:hypothetical protein
MVGEPDGVCPVEAEQLQDRRRLGCQEALLAINRLRARSNIVAPLPVVIFVGCVGLLWGSFEALHPTARQHGFAHNSLPFFWVIMAPSGTWRLNGHSCRLSFV